MLQWLGFGVNCCHCVEICTGPATLVAKLHVTSKCDRPFSMEAQRAPTSALLGLPVLVIACFSGSDLASIAAIVAKFVRDLRHLVAKLHVTSKCDQPFFMKAQKAPTSALLGLPALMIACFSGSDLASNAAIVAKFVRDLRHWWQNCM
jgi:ABC-type polysaccharide/polyol phosphate export permease